MTDDKTDNSEYLREGIGTLEPVVRSAVAIGREPLRARTDAPAPFIQFSFSDDIIVWKNGGRSRVPLHLAGDPFITGMVKFFNSTFFSIQASDSSTLARYAKSFDFVLMVLEREGLEKTPPNIYSLCLSHLKAEPLSEKGKYLLYTCMRSPARRMAALRLSKHYRRNSALLRQIPITDDERATLIQADKIAPDLRQPESNAYPDLTEYLGLDIDPEELIKSLRSFSAFFILEWQKIRKAIFKEFPKEVDEFISFSRTLKESEPGMLGPRTTSTEMSVGGCFEIVKRIDHPFLTERFVVDYLGPSTGKQNISEMAKETWDFKACTSKSAKINWLKEIPEQYYNHSSRRLCIPSAWSNLKPGTRGYPTLKKSWVGKLFSVFPVRSLLGHSISEQVCMAWIFASDRHQLSNLRWMTIEDLAITDNSISTVLDPHTIKHRASRTSGTSYAKASEKDEGFPSVEGHTYRRKQPVYTVIMAHKAQLEAASKNGLVTGNSFTEDIKDLWFFSEIRDDSQNRCFRFWQQNRSNLELLLCAMSGSLSNQYLLENCPEAELFLQAIKKAYLLGAAKGNPRGGGKIGVGVSHVARLVVNIASGKLYAKESTPLSNNSDAGIADEDHQRSIARDAALHNHSVETKLNVYANKLPAYIAKSSRFGARVGDEMVSMASQLGVAKLENTSVSTMTQLRKSLGISTRAERDLEQINEILEQVDLEGFAVDELGLMTDSNGKTVVIRHPITIALIQSALDSLDRQLSVLEYSNEKRLQKAVMKYMYLKMLLSEKFTPSEIAEAKELYEDVVFPMSDILV
ncbi:MAG: hypothetical protein ACI92N_002135 [Pseudomonadales bacterium]|jgi:hypothetical protein